MTGRRRVLVFLLFAVTVLVAPALGAPGAVAAQGSALAQDASIEVGPEQQRNVSLTIYDNLALVRDERLVPFNQGANTLRFSRVAREIDPSSVRLVSLTAPADLKVLEQSFEYDLASRDRVLKKYIGKEIEVNQDGVMLPARLLAVDSQGQLTVEMYDDRIVFVPPGNVRLPELPSGLVLQPTLVWHVDARSTADHVVEADYFTGGISWRADYVCVLDAKERFAAVNGWVTLDNKSGATYPNASLKLVAGEVRTVGDEAVLKAVPMRASTAFAAGAFDEQPVFEYHSYELARRTTLADNELKQIALLSAPSVPVSKSYVFEVPDGRYGNETYAGKKETGDVKVIVEFQNKADAGLGLPLPAGKVRVYKASGDKGLDFVGEDTVGHTPRDETVRLYVGNAFDLVGERTVTDYKKTGSNSYEEACCIKLRNHKDEDVEITAVERFPGEWTILSCVPSSYQKLDASTAAFKVKVPKGKEVEILYRVRVIAG
ncbi:MAG: DUF4139 domain-containing protein [Betaproteobacteria bacterium]